MLYIKNELKRIDDALLNNIKQKLLNLEALLKEVDDHRNFENYFYRFYHQSFKVFPLQSVTESIVEALQALFPERELNKDFMQLIKKGTGKTFHRDMNARWIEETAPILEAFFHARTMLAFVVQSGLELDEAPEVLPYPWATVLYLYNGRQYLYNS